MQYKLHLAGKIIFYFSDGSTLDDAVKQAQDFGRHVFKLASADDQTQDSGFCLLSLILVLVSS